MTSMTRQLACLLLGGALAACASRDRVTFVTSTNIAIDADATTQSASIGYHRREGYLGPAYENGAVPPIVAKLRSNLSVWDPRVHQFYATGKAAVLATCQGGKAIEDETSTPGTGTPTNAATTTPAPPAGAKCPAIDEPPLKGNRRFMFFGTGSVIGFKIGWAGTAPESITFGYKRKEFSTLPIGREQSEAVSPVPAGAPEAEDMYGSVLASIDMDAKVFTPDDTNVGLGQFFATGVAAQNLANTKLVREAVAEEAGASVRQSLRTIDVSSVLGPDNEFLNPTLGRINTLIYPPPQDPENPVADETQFRRVQKCMEDEDAPTSRVSALKNDPEYQKYIEPVARCLGI